MDIKNKIHMLKSYAGMSKHECYRNKLDIAIEDVFEELDNKDKLINEQAENILKVTAESFLKDKVIEQMIDYIYDITSNFTTKDSIKDHFENKVKEDIKNVR